MDQLDPTIELIRATLRDKGLDDPELDMACEHMDDGVPIEHAARLIELLQCCTPIVIKLVSGIMLYDADTREPEDPECEQDWYTEFIVARGPTLARMLASTRCYILTSATASHVCYSAQETTDAILAEFFPPQAAPVHNS